MVGARYTEGRLLIQDELMGLFKKTSPRRNQVRKNIPVDRFQQISRFANRDNLLSTLIWVVFVVLSAAVLSFDFNGRPLYRTLILTTTLVVLVSSATTRSD